jgi:hypothetical protein
MAKVQLVAVINAPGPIGPGAFAHSLLGKIAQLIASESHGKASVEHATLANIEVAE